MGLMLNIIIAVSLVTSQESTIGSAYSDSHYAATVTAAAYGNGSKEWDENNQRWLDSDSDEPYPEDLDDVEGDGYRDSRDAPRINKTKETQ